MKIATLGLSVVCGLALASAAQAQCGCGMSHAAPMTSYYHAPMHSSSMMSAPMSMSTPMSSMPSRSMSSANIAYVNKLASPVPRANYTLNYAVHLTDGRILLSDFVPPGHSVRGIESQSGAGARRLNTQSIPSGRINVTDPIDNSMVTTF